MLIPSTHSLKVAAGPIEMGAPAASARSLNHKVTRQHHFAPLLIIIIPHCHLTRFYHSLFSQKILPSLIIAILTRRHLTSLHAVMHVHTLQPCTHTHARTHCSHAHARTYARTYACRHMLTHTLQYLCISSVGFHHLRSSTPRETQSCLPAVTPSLLGGGRGVKRKH